MSTVDGGAWFWVLVLVCSLQTGREDLGRKRFSGMISAYILYQLQMVGSLD
jgi:hypothetical protein